MASFIMYRHIIDNLCTFHFISPNAPGISCPYWNVRMCTGGRLCTSRTVVLDRLQEEQHKRAGHGAAGEGKAIGRA
jgi:hypothetical protein